MGAVAAGFFIMTGALSSMSAGISAAAQQREINHNICTLAKQMTQYKENMKDFDNILSLETAEVRSQTTDLMFEIATMQDSIRKQHAHFKKTYMMWSVVGIIFMILLVFIFASKIVILNASTTGPR